MGCCFPTLAPNRARRWATLFRADRRKKADPSTSLRMTTVLGDRLLLSHSFANCAKGWGTHFRAARREGLALLAQGRRRTCGAGPSTALRFAQDGNRSWGCVAFQACCNCASGWGTCFRAARREGGPCLRKAKTAPAVRVLRLRYASLRMTTVLGMGCCFPTLAPKNGARRWGTLFVLLGVKAGLACARQEAHLWCGSFDCATLRSG